MNLLTSSKSIQHERYYLYQYNYNSFRLVCCKSAKDKGYEEITKDDPFEQIEVFFGLSQNDELIHDAEINRISLSRTKRNIREIALCNDFTYFATLTVNSKHCNRFSLQECQNKLKYLIHERIRRKNKHFKYIFITEKHKDGAYHFHGLVKDLELYTNANGYYSSKVFDEIGFNSFSLIKDYNKCCNYITKYITKDCIRNENNQIYISSRGLKKATRYEIQPLDFDFTYQNDYVKIRDFTAEELTTDEKLKFLKIKEGNLK